MRIALIGIGQGGGKVTDKLLEYDSKKGGSKFIQGCVAVNTARQDLKGLEYVPEDNRELIGESEVKGNGVGADNRRGRDIMQKEYSEVMKHLNDMPIHKIDAFLTVAALGGGTGSGGMPVIAEKIKERFEEPVYGLGILPSTEEGQIYSVNAARSLESCVNKTDNLMIFDNDEFNRGAKNLEAWYDELNTMLAERFGTLLSSGEVGEDDYAAESVVDASEVINTLECGGITSLGYASDELDPEDVNPGILSKIVGDNEVDEGENVSRLKGLCQKSLSGRLTLKANIESTERALVIFSGPPKYLSRKGIEEGRSVIERRTNCMEVRGGDYPRPNFGKVTVTVVLSGLHDISRIRELQKIAVEADKKIQDVREQRDENLDELLQNEDAEEIDNLLD